MRPTFRSPLDWPSGWNRTTEKRTPSRYSIKPGKAVQDLVKELRLMGAEGVVITSDMPVRINGSGPYVGALTELREDTGVAIYFFHAGRRCVIACDRWALPWENIRAVGLAVAALRSIERCGASEIINRAYAGFSALPAPSDSACWDVLGVAQGSDEATVAKAYRALAKKLHPDHGGSVEAMAKLNAARDEALGAERAPDR